MEHSQNELVSSAQVQRTTSAPILVGGCRLSPGGLHLGHYYGSFHGLEQYDPQNYFFVISDCTDASRKSRSSGLIDMLVDLRALAEGLPFRVHIVRESALRDELVPIFIGSLQRCSRSELFQVHPGVAGGTRSKSTGTVDQLLFPIHQASYLIGLDCDLACYNDDNSRFVDLARRISRRFQHSGMTTGAGPHLVSREPPRLLGSDLRRMAKGYGNTLPLSATPKMVRRFAERLVGKASEGTSDFDNETASRLEDAYCEIFGVAKGPPGPKYTGRERIRVLSEILAGFLEPIQSRRSVYASNHGEMLATLHKDESVARRQIQRTKRNCGFS